jgi:hypothetical protein
MRSLRWLTLFVVLVLAAVGCSRGDSAEETTTTAPGVTITTLPSADTTVAEDDEVDDTTSTFADLIPATGLPEYTIVSREATDNGDRVVILLDPDSYEGLTDIDLQNVLAEVVEEHPPVYEAFVVDTQAAAEAVLLASPDAEQEAELAKHHLVSLEEGFRMRFVGPFVETGVVILGS